MNLLKLWTDHCTALEKARRQIEQLSEQVPATGPGKRGRDAVLKAWREVTATSDAIDDVVTESVQPLPVSFPWRDREFTQHWQLYKDYLQEQHGIVMRSRMEQARLKAILKYSGENRETFVRTIDFYMAFGTSGIFQVNFESTLKTDENGKQQPQKIILQTNWQ